MSLRIWEFRIGHILEAIENIRTFVEGMDFEAFRQDLKTVQNDLPPLVPVLKRLLPEGAR